MFLLADSQNRIPAKQCRSPLVAAGSSDKLRDFFEYMIALPRLYAGRQWKISEIFATWLVEGAPMVVKE